MILRVLTILYARVWGIELWTPDSWFEFFPVFVIGVCLDGLAVAGAILLVAAWKESHGD